MATHIKKQVPSKSSHSRIPMSLSLSFTCGASQFFSDPSLSCRIVSRRKMAVCCHHYRWLGSLIVQKHTLFLWAISCLETLCDNKVNTCLPPYNTEKHWSRLFLVLIACHLALQLELCNFCIFLGIKVFCHNNTHTQKIIQFLYCSVTCWEHFSLWLTMDSGQVLIPVAEL